VNVHNVLSHYVTDCTIGGIMEGITEKHSSMFYYFQLTLTHCITNYSGQCQTL